MASIDTYKCAQNLLVLQQIPQLAGRAKPQESSAMHYQQLSAKKEPQIFKSRSETLLHMNCDPCIRFPPEFFTVP